MWWFDLAPPICPFLLAVGEVQILLLASWQASRKLGALRNICSLSFNKRLGLPISYLVLRQSRERRRSPVVAGRRPRKERAHVNSHCSPSSAPLWTRHKDKIGAFWLQKVHIKWQSSPSRGDARVQEREKADAARSARREHASRGRSCSENSPRSRRPGSTKSVRATACRLVKMALRLARAAPD